MRLKMLLASLALLPCSALAQTRIADAGSATTKTDNTKVPAEKKICRPKQSSTSRMAGRECLTRAEWDAIAKANNDKVDLTPRR